jgi:hypothetical protein
MDREEGVVKKLISILCLTTLLGSSVASAAQLSFDVHIGPPPPARVVRVLPRRPGPQYVWVEGYWYPQRGRYEWHNGYWTLPPYRTAHWIGPRWDSGRYYEGYWDGDHGRWDRNKHRLHRDEHDRSRGDRDNRHRS